MHPTPENEEQTLKNLRNIRGPFIIWMIMLGFMAIYVVNSIPQLSDMRERFAPEFVSVNQSFRPLLIIMAVASIILSIWFGPWLYQRHHWLLTGCPIMLIFIYAGFLSRSMPVIMVGTYPVLMIETMIGYHYSRRVMTCLTVAYLSMWVGYTAIVGWVQGIIVLSSFIFLMAIVFYYWRFYQHQVQERERVENLYTELQLAYKQVEASTVRAERQRVARELHDTLTQGLAGVVMQLEAAKSFLDQGNADRAEEIINTSMATARTALHESRITLTDLRSTTEESLPVRLQLVADAIRKNYQVTTTIQLNDIPDYSPSQLTEITRIVTEALTNVAKHAQTDQAIISGSLTDDIFKLKIIDFGTGFNTHDKKALKKTGHYGLQGIYERADRLNGVITVISAVDEGTTVTLTLPADRKELAE